MKKFFSVARATTVSFLALAVVSIGFTSCFKDKHDEVQTPVAGLMAFNLAPDKSIGVTLSGNNLYNSPLNYTSYTGGYLSVYTGQRSISTYDAFTSGGQSLATIDGNFEANKYYSLFFLGADSSYKNILVSDNIDSLSAASGQAYIRYINAVPDSVSAPTVTVTANGSNVVNTPAQYASVSEFTAVAPGEITIAAKNSAGIDVNRTISVEAKKVYTVLITGIAGSGSSPVSIKYITNGTLDDKPANASGIGQRLVIE